jgi:hypothetical protein
MNDGPLAKGIESGIVFRFEPGLRESLKGGTTYVRRITELARGLGILSAQGWMGIEQDRLALDINSKLDPDHPIVRAGKAKTAIDPGWLAWVPASKAVAAISLALDQGGAYWDGLFALADRVDRADPARADLAPLRTRLTLLATAAGARLEVDLWPHLRGLTFCVLTNASAGGQVDGAVLALHMDDEEAAKLIASDVAPRMASPQNGLKRAVLPRRSGRPDGKKIPDAATISPLGRLAGRPLQVTVRGRTVLIGWGEGSLAAALQAESRAGDAGLMQTFLSSNRQGRKPNRAGWYWPGRIRLPLKGLDVPSPLIQSLAQGRPIVWAGWNDGIQACDRICWPELHTLVKNFLDSVPLDSLAVP